MKLSKKVLAAFSMVAALAMAVSFTGCKDEDDDDENDMISKSGTSNFSINYENTSNSVSRGYKTTTNNYTEAVMQITMNESSAGAGAMGLIWDLETAKKQSDGTYAYSRAATDPRRFLIVGFNYKQTYTNGVAYYCSMYKNVTDLSANNFGVSSSNAKKASGNTTDASQKETDAASQIGDAEEIEYISLSSNNKIDIVETDKTNGNFTITVWIHEGKDEDTNAYDGTYLVSIFKGALDKTTVATTAADATAIISATDLGYVTESGTVSSTSRDKPLAAYANVYAHKTLTGSWKYVSTSGADEVVEE